MSFLLPLDHYYEEEEEEEEEDNDEFEPLTPRFSVPSSSETSAPPPHYSFDDMNHASTYLQFFKAASPFENAYAVDNTTRTPLQPVGAAACQKSQRSLQETTASSSAERRHVASYAATDSSSSSQSGSYDNKENAYLLRKDDEDRSRGSVSLHHSPTDDVRQANSSSSSLCGASFLSSTLYSEGKGGAPGIQPPTTTFMHHPSSTHSQPHRLSPPQQWPSFASWRSHPEKTPTYDSTTWEQKITHRLGRLRHPWSPYLLWPTLLRLPEPYYRPDEVQYLQEQHQWKCQQLGLHHPSHDDPRRRRFDFCLILQPQEVYGFWAKLLDFREELLGPSVCAWMEEQWQEQIARSQEEEEDDVDSILPVLVGDTDDSHISRSSGDSHPPADSTRSASTTASSDQEENDDLFLETPYSSCQRSTLRRRPPRTPALDDSGVSPLPQHWYHTPPALLRTKHPPYSKSRTDASPGLYSYLDKSSSSASRTHATSARSLFERALGSPSLLPESTPATLVSNNNNPAYTYPRKWGNPVAAVESRPPTAVSPPRALATTKSVGIVAKPPPERNTDPNCIRLEDIPNPVIARGIAARTNRTHGRLPFANALRYGGLVLRRHRPGREAVFCRISSPDGGDTLWLQTIGRDEALLALAQQRAAHPSEPQYWSLAPEADSAVQASGNLPPRLTQMLPSTWKGMRSVHMSQVVTIHPAGNADPRAANEFGTGTLRRSQSSHLAAWSFSLVLQKHSGTAVNEDIKVQWHRGEGRDSQFRYVDLEAATESDYWFILRGLLFLHRDALVGRYAKDRAAGIGTRRLDAVGCDSVREAVLHVDEFHEPLTVGWLERTLVDVRKLDTTYREGYVTKLDAVPPPSDYFLGFRSPGTAIWSRLRQAGLETQRIYSLDPNRVMIKIRCPPDRLMDVAEVLRIKLKTNEGSFAAFREDMMDDFAPMIDPLEDPPPHADLDYAFYQFRSSIRQMIIDFIIGSRVRDSGAELGPRDLGQKVQARVPLHVPAKLDAIYASWFYFWKEENWKYGRHGRSLTHATSAEFVQRDVEQGLAEPKKKVEDDDEEADRHTSAKLPNLVTRFIVGSLYQPLDSIEEYFGEKVAFYFTWLEHTAKHLIYLSVAGLIMLFFQLGSGRIDHPLRPLFSIVVMIWTFIVLINWKKRANYMAYRWGTMNFKEQETTRPQFIGVQTKDDITGESIITYPKWKRWLKYCISFPLTLLFTMGTLILILWVHANRDLQLATYFSDAAPTTNPPEVHGLPLSAIGRRGPVVNVELSRENLQSPKFWFIVVLLPSMLGLFLPLLNFLLMRLSIVLNDFENYRTESEYRTYLIIKVFSFRFVCYFATLYYYCILSIGEDTSTESGQQAIENGILRVGMGVLVYTTVAQWWQYFVHICFPMLIGQLRMHHRNQRLANELHAIEAEEAEIFRLSTIRFDEPLKERQIRLVNKRLLLEQAQDDIWIELLLPAHDSFPEYIQAVVQFTFVSCFSVVLPITPMIVLFNYLISMRLDAYKLCRGRRRPIAEKTGGIGVWEHVLHIVAVISVLTNCWLMGFLSSQFYWIKEEITEIGLFAVIVIWEHIMLLIKYIMSNSISPLPKTVRDSMKREQYILDQQRTTVMQERRQQQQQQLNEEHSRMMEDTPSTRCSESRRRRSKQSRDTAATPVEERQSSARLCAA